MGYLPIFLDVTNLRCLVVGGGEIGARKVESVLEAEARVTVISPAVTAYLAELSRRGQIVHVDREYIHGDMQDFALVFDATDDPRLHRELAGEARELGIAVNVADVPELCSFITPAVARRGELQIAISTAGASPAFAARLRRELETQFGFEYGLALEIMRAARTLLQASALNPAERSRRLKDLAESALPEALRESDCGAVARLLETHLGAGVNLSALGLDPDRMGLSRRAGGAD